MIHQCTQDDIPWLIALARDCYKDFDVESSEKWLSANINNPSIIIIRGDDAAALAVICSQFWNPKEKNCELEFIASRATRFGAVCLLQILRHINNLRNNLGCANFYLNSRLADLAPFAKKLGAELVGKSYVLK